MARKGMGKNMIELRVCIGSACHINGSNNVVATFRHLIEEYQLHDKVLLQGAFCMRDCAQNGVAVSVNGQTERITDMEARKFFKEKILPLTK